MSAGDPRELPSWQSAEISEPLRLHENENPYGCSLLVQESLSIYDAFARKQGRLPRPLLPALSRYTGRSASNLYLADSPEELLRRLLLTLSPSNHLVACAPYGEILHRVCCRAGIEPLHFERQVGERLRTSDLIGQFGDQKPLLYVGSPNDPTGDIATPLEIVSLLRTGFTVIADETYAEFTDKTLSVLGGEFPNFVSLRSFAPWAGLWGIPVSYALVSGELREALETRWPTEMLSAVSRIAAGASLDDQVMLLNRVKHIRLERARLFRRLRKLNFVQPLPSHGPFVLCEVTRGSAQSVRELLAAEGILVRDCAEYGLPSHIRISVGTSADTDRLFSAMCRVAVAV